MSWFEECEIWNDECKREIILRTMIEEIGFDTIFDEKAFNAIVFLASGEIQHIQHYNPKKHINYIAWGFDLQHITYGRKDVRIVRVNDEQLLINRTYKIIKLHKPKLRTKKEKTYSKKLIQKYIDEQI